MEIMVRSGISPISIVTGIFLHPLSDGPVLHVLFRTNIS